MKTLLLCAALLGLCGNAFADGKLYEFPFRTQKDVWDAAAKGLAIAGINHDRKVFFVYAENGAVPTGSAAPVASRAVRAVDSRYATYDVVRQKLRDIEKAFPQIAMLDEVGGTHEGRAILAMRLGKQGGTAPRRSILIDAMHHAREVMTVEVALDVVDYLAKNYGRDAEVTAWLDAFDVWVVPMVNPDGNDRVHVRDNMWRKNTKKNYGVDLNRNYPTNFNKCNGSSGSTGSETYRGPSKGSEEETQALIRLASEIRPAINISYHSFSEMVLYPMGCPNDSIAAADRTRYLAVSKGMAAQIVRDDGRKGYRVGTSYQLLYPTDGVSADHMYRAYGTLGVVVEMNSDRLGFQPAYSQVAGTVQKQRAGWMYMLREMAKGAAPFAARGR